MERDFSQAGWGGVRGLDDLAAWRRNFEGCGVIGEERALVLGRKIQDLIVSVSEREGTDRIGNWRDFSVDDASFDRNSLKELELLKVSVYELALGNWRLLHLAAEDFPGFNSLRREDKEDLMQEGLMGLVDAAIRWDPDYGGGEGESGSISFSTFAVPTARGKMIRAFWDVPTIRLGSWGEDQKRILVKTEQVWPVITKGGGSEALKVLYAATWIDNYHLILNYPDQQLWFDSGVGTKMVRAQPDLDWVEDKFGEWMGALSEVRASGGTMEDVMDLKENDEDRRLWRRFSDVVRLGLVLNPMSVEGRGLEGRLVADDDVEAETEEKIFSDWVIREIGRIVDGDELKAQVLEWLYLSLVLEEYYKSDEGLTLRQIGDRFGINISQTSRVRMKLRSRISRAIKPVFFEWFPPQKHGFVGEE